MGAEELINASSDLIPSLALEVGKLATWLQALGL